jgi:PAS domain S-box-containing protein
MSNDPLRQEHTSTEVPSDNTLSEDARRKDALYRLTDRLHHAQSLEDIYAAALEAILSGLKCDRASILLFDDAKVMRFVAWSGLPDDYRRAAEGHTPWTADAKDPAPVCIDDFATSDIDATLRQVILDEGIGAAAFIPLLTDGKLIGKFMTYFNRPHTFSRDEIELALTIARQLAFAVQRRHAEDDLREREARFRAFLTATSEVIYSMSADWTEMRYLDGKQFIADTTGPSTLWLDKYIYPDDQPLIIEAIQHAIRTKSVFELEHRVISADGSLGWMFSRAIPLLDETGAIKEWFGAARNVTNRKRTETLDREQASLLELIVSGRPVDECLRALTSAVARLEPNVRAAILLGDASGTRVERIVAADTPPLFAARLLGAPIDSLAIGQLRIAHGICACYSEPIKGTDGRTFASFMLCVGEAREPTEWERRIAQFGTHIGSIVIARQQSEEALAEQRRLYEAILTNTPDLAYVFDRNHRFIYANEGLLKTWGKSWDEAIGKTCLELGYEPWHAEMHDREIEQVIATKRPIRGEVPFTGTYGRRVHDYLFVPVLGAHGEVVAVAGTTRDVTDLKRNEEMLREADRRKDEFLAMLAHELRNPLAPISNAIQILRLERAPPTAQQQARTILERQTAQLSRLVDDLLEVARITTGRVQLRRDWIMISGIVERAVESVRSLIEQHAHSLALALPEEPLWVYADAARLEQVLVNLLNNAAKYTPDGGRIELTVGWQGECVAVTVRDTGIGIDPQLLPHVFDLFTQAERSLDRSYGGLGVGLSLVKSLVEMHGGSIAAQSTPGEGSEFTFKLPASRTHRAHLADRSAQAESNRQRAQEANLRIVVVDDNADAADSLAALLSASGHEVHTAYDGVAALRAVNEHRPHIALLDIGLPQMNGYELAQRLRGESSIGQTGIGQTILIAMTGYGQLQDRERARSAGFDAHLVKPVDFATVEQTIGELLKAREEQHASRRQPV